jgi:hypothetical protein
VGAAIFCGSFGCIFDRLRRPVAVGFVSRCCWWAKRIAKCWPMEWGLLAVGQSTSSTPWAVKDPHSVTKAPRRLVSELHAARIDAAVVLGCTDCQHVWESDLLAPVNLAAVR